LRRRVLQSLRPTTPIDRKPCGSHPRKGAESVQRVLLSAFVVLLVLPVGCSDEGSRGTRSGGRSRADTPGAQPTFTWTQRDIEYEARETRFRIEFAKLTVADLGVPNRYEVRQYRRQQNPYFDVGDPFERAADKPAEGNKFVMITAKVTNLGPRGDSPTFGWWMGPGGPELETQRGIKYGVFVHDLGPDGCYDHQYRSGMSGALAPLDVGESLVAVFRAEIPQEAKPAFLEGFLGWGSDAKQFRVDCADLPEGALPVPTDGEEEGNKAQNTEDARAGGRPRAPSSRRRAAAIDVPVPVLQQDTGGGCARACVAMVLQYYDFQADPASAGMHAAVPDREGAHIYNVVRPAVAALSDRQLQAEFFRADEARWASQLREELRRGHPVIALLGSPQRMSHWGNRPEVPHFVVVRGVGTSGEIIINDPAAANGPKHVKAREFGEAWGTLPRPSANGERLVNTPRQALRVSHAPAPVAEGGPAPSAAPIAP